MAKVLEMDTLDVLVGKRVLYKGDISNPDGEGIIYRVHQNYINILLDDGRDLQPLMSGMLANHPRFEILEGEADRQAAKDAQRKVEEKIEEYRRQEIAKRQKIEDEIKKGEKLFNELGLTDCKAIIYADLRKNESDTMTDYFASSSARIILLCTSKHTRNNFREFRKAAKLHKLTAHLADAPKSWENRENYSMGRGYYLGEYSHSGWHVRKAIVEYDQNLIYRALGRGDHCLLEEKKPKPKSDMWRIEDTPLGPIKVSMYVPCASDFICPHGRQTIYPENLNREKIENEVKNAGSIRFQVEAADATADTYEGVKINGREYKNLCCTIRFRDPKVWAYWDANCGYQTPMTDAAREWLKKHVSPYVEKWVFQYMDRAKAQSFERVLDKVKDWIEREEQSIGEVRKAYEDLKKRVAKLP